MDPASTGGTLKYGLSDQFQNYRGSQSYQDMRVSGNSRMVLGDVYHGPVTLESAYSTTRDAEDSDTDTDSFEGMPEGWNAAQSPENDTYYVSPINPDSGAGTTTRIKPMPGWAPADVSFREELERTFKAALQPEPERLDRANAGEHSPTTPGEDYYARVEACASRLGALWPRKEDMFPPENHGSTRCSVFTEGSAVTWDEYDPAEAAARAVEALVNAMKEEKDTICIIENVNGRWMEALGAAAELDIPVEFFAGHASKSAWYPDRQGTHIPAMDDIVERALPLGRRILRKKKEDSVKKIINTLCEASVVVKTSVDNWMLYGVTSHEINHAASCVAECASVLGRLKETATSAGRSADSTSPKSDPISARALHRQMADLEFLRLRRFFNLDAAYYFEQHVPSNKTNQPREVTSSYLARNIEPLP